MNRFVLTASVMAVFAAVADDGFLEKPAGVKIGQRITLRPYVSFSYSYDSNVDSARDGNGGNTYWSVNPGIGIDYLGSSWKLSGMAYYTYHAYTKGESGALNNGSYGEQLSYSWSNISSGGPGWSLVLSERYVRVDQNDDFTHGDGKGLWRDRQQFDATAALQRRFNEYLHSTLNGGYYWMDYANDKDAFAPLYGWSRWNAGLQLGCTFSKWTDVFVSGSYQGYDQDCREGAGSSNSDGWTAHIGVGSYMTDRISYRVSGGVSTFNYGKASRDSGFTYQGSGRWRIGETWMTSLLFSSYYQPSERQYASAVRCDCVSWGLAKTLIRGKVNSTFDIAYRHDTHMHTYEHGAEWDLNLLTARLGVNYTVNRLLTVFARGEFQNEINDGAKIPDKKYDYERWRVTVGLKFTY